MVKSSVRSFSLRARYTFFYNRYMAFCILYALIFFNTDNCFQILPGKMDSSLKFFCTSIGVIYITGKNIWRNAWFQLRLCYIRRISCCVQKFIKFLVLRDFGSLLLTLCLWFVKCIVDINEFVSDLLCVSRSRSSSFSFVLTHIWSIYKIL